MVYPHILSHIISLKPKRFFSLGPVISYFHATPYSLNDRGRSLPPSQGENAGIKKQQSALSGAGQPSNFGGGSCLGRNLAKKNDSVDKDMPSFRKFNRADVDLKKSKSDFSLGKHFSKVFNKGYPEFLGNAKDQHGNPPSTKRILDKDYPLKGGGGSWKKNKLWKNNLKKKDDRRFKKRFHYNSLGFRVPGNFNTLNLLFAASRKRSADTILPLNPSKSVFTKITSLNFFMGLFNAYGFDTFLYFYIKKFIYFFFKRAKDEKAFFQEQQANIIFPELLKCNLLYVSPSEIKKDILFYQLFSLFSNPSLFFSLRQHNNLSLLPLSLKKNNLNFFLATHFAFRQDNAFFYMPRSSLVYLYLCSNSRFNLFVLRGFFFLNREVFCQKNVHFLHFLFSPFVKKNLDYSFFRSIILFFISEKLRAKKNLAKGLGFYSTKQKSKVKIPNLIHYFNNKRFVGRLIYFRILLYILRYRKSTSYKALSYRLVNKKKSKGLCFLKRSFAKCFVSVFDKRLKIKKGSYYKGYYWRRRGKLRYKLSIKARKKLKRRLRTFKFLTVRLHVPKNIEFNLKTFNFVLLNSFNHVTLANKMPFFLNVRKLVTFFSK